MYFPILMGIECKGQHPKSERQTDNADKRKRPRKRKVRNRERQNRNGNGKHLKHEDKPSYKKHNKHAYKRQHGKGVAP